jgi:hypothetical protein
MDLNDTLIMLATKLPTFAENCATVRSKEAALKAGILGEYQVVTNDLTLISELLLEIEDSGIQQKALRGFQNPMEASKDISIQVATVAWIGNKARSGVKITVWGPAKKQAEPEQESTDSPWST